MIFMTGGAYSGKEACARKLLDISEDDWNRSCARGGETAFASILKSPYIADYHALISRLIEEGTDPSEFTARLIVCDPEIIIMDEVGCGITPLTRKERDYREDVGRCGQQLSAAAAEVYRVVSGICLRIK